MILTILKILGSHELNDNAHPKTIEITFSFPEFVPAWKKSVHSLTMESHDHRVPYVNLHQHTKNQSISKICSGDMVD